MRKRPSINLSNFWAPVHQWARVILFDIWLSWSLISLTGNELNTKLTIMVSKMKSRRRPIRVSQMNLIPNLSTTVHYLWSTSGSERRYPWCHLPQTNQSFTNFMDSKVSVRTISSGCQMLRVSSFPLTNRFKVTLPQPNRSLIRKRRLKRKKSQKLPRKMSVKSSFINLRTSSRSLVMTNTT
jgi:hypothetical protein